MKMEVTRRGVYDAKGNEIEVGTVVDVKGDKVPGYLLNKAIEVKEKRTAITNPAEKPVQQPVDTKTAAEVLALAETAHFMTFKAEATKLLGDKTPGSKADIVTALEELATKPA